MNIPPLVEKGPALTVDEVRRYSRHLIIPDVAMAGQQRLMNAKVLCVGAGGLGSPALMLEHLELLNSIRSMNQICNDKSFTAKAISERARHFQLKKKLLKSIQM
jgi:hypothetical protein